MIEIKQAELLRWLNRTVEFNELLVELNCSPPELAEALGLRQPHSIIASRSAWGWWPDFQIDTIVWARSAYDAGQVELYHSRTKDHFFLHCQARKVPTRPRCYFSQAGNGIEIR